MPESIFAIENTTGMKPKTGDIALDIRNKNIVIFCRDEEPSVDFIPSEPRCSFHVAIRERMKQTKAYFGE